MIGPLKRRSSWPSSFATAVIGWIGFTVIVALILVGAALMRTVAKAGLSP